MRELGPCRLRLPTGNRQRRQNDRVHELNGWIQLMGLLQLGCEDQRYSSVRVITAPNRRLTAP